MTLHPIPKLNNLYFVTKCGKVWSNNYKNTGKGNWLKPIIGKRGYYTVAINRKKIPVHRLMAMTFFDEFKPDCIVDHIDQNKTNNQIKNLRITDKKGNSNNRSLQSNNTSGYRGVSWDKNMKKWVAYIKNEGKMIRIGYYATAKEASIKRNEKAIELHGDFATISNHNSSISSNNKRILLRCSSSVS